MLNEFDADSLKVINHFKLELSKLQLGRASTSLVEDILVNSYGSMQAMKGLANITIKDSQTIFVQPWDKGIIKDIEKAIQDSDLGINPQNDGHNIILKIPATTEERRKELVKRVGVIAEESKINIRNVRVHAKKKIEKQKEDKFINEDDVKMWEKRLQDKVDDLNKEIARLSDEKEKQIMSV